jgi:hypothetical protein
VRAIGATLLGQIFAESAMPITIREMRPEDARAFLEVRTQLNSRLALIPCRRAISATDAPGDSASATICCFSSADHVLRARFIRLRGSVLSNTAFNDHRPAIGFLNVHLGVMDTKPGLTRDK